MSKKIKFNRIHCEVFDRLKLESYVLFGRKTSWPKNSEDSNIFRSLDGLVRNDLDFNRWLLSNYPGHRPSLWFLWQPSLACQFLKSLLRYWLLDVICGSESKISILRVKCMYDIWTFTKRRHLNGNAIFPYRHPVISCNQKSSVNFNFCHSLSKKKMIRILLFIGENCYYFRPEGTCEIATSWTR